MRIPVLDTEPLERVLLLQILASLLLLPPELSQLVECRQIIDQPADETDALLITEAATRLLALEDVQEALVGRLPSRVDVVAVHHEFHDELAIQLQVRHHVVVVFA